MDQQNAHEAMVTRSSSQITSVNSSLGRRLPLWVLAAILSLPVFAHAQPAASLAAENIVQEHLGIFQVVDELLDPLERVELKQNEITIWFRTRVDGGNRNKKVCAGARWLIIGRLGGATGSKMLFRKNPKIQSITLVFFDVETSVKLGKKNRYRQSRRAVEQTRFKLSRTRSLNLDTTQVRQALERTDCHLLAPDLLSELVLRKP